MADAVAHLVNHVLPSAPYRQWVLSLPKPLRLSDEVVHSLVVITAYKVAP